MTTNWHTNVFFGIHYDLHANASDTELGRELTAEHLAERLRRVRPDWIQADCKGHPGYTSWPTEIGSTSPGVVNDALRIHRDVTAELGIKLGMHYSGVWDSRAIELHPDWARLDEAGDPDANMTCRMSGYDTELMIPQMLEIVEKYDVDGFWVDGENWASKPCYCDRCRAEFTRRTGITAIPEATGQPGWDAWLAFHRDLFVEHVTRYAEAVHARKPTCLVCSNWMYTVRQPDPVVAPVDYLSGDYDWAWGANRAAVEGRVLDSRGKTWDLMAWGFTKTGAMGANPPWVMKTATHLCQELAEVIALGGAVMVYNTPQRTGRLTGWHQDLLAEVAGWCRARKEACFGSHSASQAVVLHLADHYYSCNQPLYNYGEAAQPLEGALHALLETGRSTDVLTEDAALRRLGGYALVVVPEQTRLSPAVIAALEAFARAGGHVLMSGAHLAHECPALVGAEAAVPAIIDRATYLPVGGRAVPASGPWQPVSPMAGTTVLAHRLAQQEPDKDDTGQAAVTQRRVGKGSVVAIHGSIFRDYLLGHYPLLRQFISALIDGLGIPWEVSVEAPPRLEMIARRKDDRLVINLVNRGAGEALSPHRVIVEELPAVTNVVLRIRRDCAPQSVMVAPDGPTPTWTYADNLLTIEVPRVDIHSAVVVG
jgi:alpha-L-fucosidase